MLTETEVGSLVVAHLDPEGPAARPCFEISLFYDLPRSALGLGMVAACDAFITRSPEPFKWFRTQSMKAAVAMRTAASTMITSLMSSPEFAKPGDVGLTLHSGPTARDFRAPSLTFFSTEQKGDGGKAVGQTFLRFCVEVTPGVDQGRDFFALATRVAAAQPAACGHAGYSWLRDSGDMRLERAMGQQRGLLSKHPAMGYHDPFSFYPFIGHGLIQVGWLTFVGAALLARVGGMARLAEGLPGTVGLSELGHGAGVVLVAGPEPVLGSVDPKRAAELAPYREVGGRLAGVRVPDALLEYLDLAGVDDEDEARDWYLRFMPEDDD